MNIKRHCQFLLGKEKGATSGKLKYRIKWNSNTNIVDFNLGYRVEVDKWSTEAQRCKANTSHGPNKVSAFNINKEISRFETLISDIFHSFEKSSHIPSTQELRDAVNIKLERIKPESENKTFYDYYDEFTSTVGVQNEWDEGTYKKFKSIRFHLFAFKPKLMLSDITEDLLFDFVAYQHEVNLRNTTIVKYMNFVRWFLRWCSNKEYYKGNLHNTFKLKLKGTDGNCQEVIHLEWDELLYLLTFEFPEEKQYISRVRDVFCFCCFTGLRYSDVYKLKKDDIKNEAIYVVTKKTSDSLKIELNNYSKSILQKYSTIELKDNKALPVISNVKMNEYLKEMGELAKIDTPQRIVHFKSNVRHENVFPKYALLTTHTGRRTFIVNALYLGIPAEVVMKWTGHSDYKAMKPYVKIIDKLKVKEMNKFNVPSSVLSSKTDTKTHKI